MTRLLCVLALAAVGCEADAEGFGSRTGQSGGTGGFDAFGSGGGGGGGGSPLPCDIQPIVQSKCGFCHGAMPNYGAPMALVTAGDFQAIKPDGFAMHVVANNRINAQMNAMPPPNQPQLTAEEKQTLSNWLSAGAPAGNGACGGGTGGVNGGGGILGSGGLDGAGGTIEPPKDADACYEFRAFAAGDPNAPFMKPGTSTSDSEEYYNFVFKKPWEGNPQALTIRHLIDNTPIVHHTLIYQSEGSLSAGVTPSLGTHGNDMLLAGWVPGGSDTVLPNDVGLELAGGDFTMEIHYYNPQATPQPDASGFEICVTYQNRPNNAGIHWLGSEPLGVPSLQWNGTCTPNYGNGPITILTSWPHMHLEGRHFKTVINRGSGGQEVLYDGDFEFEFQGTYDTPATLTQGDTLTTTCDFAVPKAFGTRTTDEMCYNFVVAYPNGAFNSGGGLTSGVNHCMF